MISKIVAAGMMIAFSISANASEKIDGVRGKEIIFSVESKPTTGYSWMIKSLPEELIFVSSDYKQSSECGKGAVGCSGTQTFTFIASKRGDGELKFIHGQPFDKSSWKEKIVNVNIK